ncbi:zinc-dependent metalloprotease [Alteromonas sp. CYL-A6]|uniref:zinc-dependent metalloprotease n=1 Tax=Alteromonas nitratireducens TaxID=3390813 RepID=UPI0034B7B2CB
MRHLIILLSLMSSAVWAAVPSLDDFTAGMEKRDGFVTFYYDSQTDSVYLDISNVGQEMIFQSSLPYGVGSNDIGLDRGQLGETRLVKFERFGNKVMLRQLNTLYRADTDNSKEKQSIAEAFADSVIAGFEIVAQSDGHVLINYTPFLLSDIHGIGTRLSAQEQGSYSVDTSRSGVYLARSKAFERNTELEAMVTFSGSKPGEFVRQVAPEPLALSVHLHHSFVALPEPGYQMRVFDPYSGYWKFRYFDYATPISEPTEKRYILRHRLQKKNPLAPRSEAVEPIVYYLDPGIPEPVMSALKDGASWWNEAFEAIGYKNAFQVKVLPDGADPMDVRYNVIQWVHRATRGWSYGSSVVDPRTGEIIKGHVTLGSLRVRQDYLIALGLTSPFADGNSNTNAQQQLALARIRQLSAHEVGHTLGLAHNFAASEKGRSSVMDYPHPQLRLAEGRVMLEDAYDTGMGEWDKHAIAYGYQQFASVDEQQGLDSLITRARKAGLPFKTDADTRSAHHASANGHMWDNGSDPLDEFDALTALRRFALDRLGLSTLPEGATLSSLEDTLVPVYLLHRYQLEAVAKQVGGVQYEYEQKGDYASPRGQSFVAASVQQRAMSQLMKATSADFLSLPDALKTLIPPTAFGDDITREHFASRMSRMLDPLTMAEAAAGHALDLLLMPERLNRLNYQSAMRSDLASVAQLTHALLKQHWFDNDSAQPLDQRLQLVVLTKLVEAASKPALGAEVRVAINAELAALSAYLEDQETPVSQVLHGWLTTYLETGNWPGSFKVMPLPPGSPI